MITPQELRELSVQAKIKAEEEMDEFLQSKLEIIEKACIEQANAGFYKANVDISFLNVPDYFTIITAADYILNYFKQKEFNQCSYQRDVGKIILTLGWFKEDDEIQEEEEI